MPNSTVSRPRPSAKSARRRTPAASVLGTISALRPTRPARRS
jgi:hypothetical protein